ncbi:hypothetical protein SAMN04488023_1076 [Pedobacter rhizosphaerae]|uniref:Uncharacterized protein n=1 Tax=Pedobacter rhizosphaerae TaxID=390241 RepID=A0A1H9N2U6_9SPHI|nr:hypothetical protein SAMN04488023_1076 [Pedobacter rhizosphaerae]
MTNFNYLLTFTAIIVVIEFYSEIHLRNYGSITERLYHLFGWKALFNIFKLSLLFAISYVSFGLFNLFGFLSKEFIRSNIIDLNDGPLYLYLIVPFCVSIVIILFNSAELFQTFRTISTSNKQLDSFITNITYIIFRLISFILTFFIFRNILKYIIELDNYFSANNQSLLDWLNVTKDGQDNYNKGVYFSLILTTLIFIFFNNAFIKKNSDTWDYRKIKMVFFKYFFITIILCIGLFFGFFSIFNGIFNILNSSFSEWFSKDNLLGIFPIRISSLLIIIYLSTYIYKQVLHGRIAHFIVLGFLPLRQIKEYDRFMIFEDRETLFFTQISFYILNIALAELFIILGYKSIYLSLLNFSILFILDDFKIISEYSKNLRSVLRNHFNRIWLFNLIMFIASVILLFHKNHILLLCVYIILTLILTYYYLRNARAINFERQ